MAHETRLRASSDPLLSWRADPLRKAGFEMTFAKRIAAEERQEQLADLRAGIRDARRVATCVAFGPRFLRSTGQAFKGGSNSGVFLQVTQDDSADLDVPGQKYSLGANLVPRGATAMSASSSTSTPTR